MLTFENKPVLKEVSILKSLKLEIGNGMWYSYAVRFSTDNIISLFHISQFALLKNHIMNAYVVV